MKKIFGFKVSPVIEMAERKIRSDGILPDYVNITWKEYDDKCKPALATMAAIDAYAKFCAHLIIGPSCEYSVCKLSKSVSFRSLNQSKLSSFRQPNREIFLQRGPQYNNRRRLLLRLRRGEEKLQWWISYASSCRSSELWTNFKLHGETYGKFWLEAGCICLWKRWIRSSWRNANMSLVS